ncbi:MAG: hypothetical protein AUJ72_02935 [Candidatus Omnitrophica bacterium CG1_02_46_14]|nr:MAG: hypothetical protein AUJ72_02935 [Candidatus Omnitrophica bacterium CG1_02_46_14]
MGDVLRTTPLLSELKRNYPVSKITWLVEPVCRSVLENNPYIDSLITYSKESLSLLKQEPFDLSVNLDKEPEAIDALMEIPSKKKMGFGRSKEGTLCALDSLSDYAYRLGIDDELKFKKNKKTYQEISFEQMGFQFHKEEYVFSVDFESAGWAINYLKRLGFDLAQKSKPVVGLNTGSGKRFAGKRLPVAAFILLAEKFYSQMNATVFLLGGEDEVERNAEIFRASKVPTINTGSHSIQRFSAIVQACDLVVSGDTTAMHIAIAVKVPVVAYFASTCSAEIELYDRGEKIVSKIPCAPCYKKNCPIQEQCMKDMSAENIFKVSKRVLGSITKRP